MVVRKGEKSLKKPVKEKLSQTSSEKKVVCVCVGGGLFVLGFFLHTIIPDK